jgi:uncharacterized protein YdiU (UPF0061 family)
MKIHMNDKSQTKKRGPKRKRTDLELMEIALQIKNKVKHQIITPSQLERETGIGRNTWNRNIREYIEELNRPITRQLGLTDDDTVYFPNIEALFELYGNNQTRIISELHKFEVLLQDIYRERNEYKQNAEGYQKFKDKFENQEEAIKKLRSQLNHYKTEYDKIVTSSVDPEIRMREGLKENVISFKNYQGKYISLSNLESHFPKNEPMEKDESESNMQSLGQMFPELLE